MNRNPLVRRLLLPAALLALAGCGEITDPQPETASEAELTFVRLAPEAPPIEETEVRFWAVRGEDREVQIRYYHPDTHGYAKCLRFVVPAQALRTRPDGTPFAVGDSVEITIRMPDPRTLSFEFDPAGLRFDPDHPATVEVVYLYADEDVNGDGTVDATDAAMRARWEFWRQEAPGEPWQAVATVLDAFASEARATITGFTKYALASE